MHRPKISRGQSLGDENLIWNSDKIQKLTDSYIEKIESLFNEKEKDILKV